MAFTICTWLCADAPGEESIYKQMRGKSSAQTFQAVYWRNIYLFYLSSRKVNHTAAHILFTNSLPPVVDGFDMQRALEALEVQVVQVPFDYKTPTGYYEAWRNQFYEFSILDHIARHYPLSDQWLLLDSDCVFTRSVENLPAIAERHNGILTYTLVEPPGTSIHGLTQPQMQTLYAELLQKPVPTLPTYHAGEFYFSDGNWAKRFSDDFALLWPILLERHAQNKSRLTEEAHVLSYLYYKYGVSDVGTANPVIKRLWTQPFIFRNVEPADTDYAIWHLPHEKRYGLKTIFGKVIKRPLTYWLQLPDAAFMNMLKYHLTVPTISPFIYATRLLPIQAARVVYYGLQSALQTVRGSLKLAGN